MLPYVIHAYSMNMKFAETLVSDLSTEQMCQQPHGVVNHPAWSLGHLAVSEGHLCQILGVASPVPKDWEKTFPTGGIPSAEVNIYPSRDELLDVLGQLHGTIIRAMTTVSQKTLAQTHPNEGTRKHFPTVGDFAVFLMTSHGRSHLGQIAAWRRAMGLGPPVR